MTSVLLASVWKPGATYGLRLGASINVDKGAASAAHQLGLGVRRQLTVQTAQRAPGIVERGIHLRYRGIRPALSKLVAQNEHGKTSLLPVRRWPTRVHWSAGIRSPAGIQGARVRWSEIRRVSDISELAGLPIHPSIQRLASAPLP